MAKNKYRVDDRRDSKWGYPNGARENWNNPTIATFFADVMAPGLSQNEINVGREMFNGAFESMLSGAVMPKELAEDGEWREYYAPGCQEEPDAPPVRLHCRFPKVRKSEKLPAIIYFFAAGMAGKPDYFDTEIATYSKELNCVVVAPHYRVHPENKQPAQLNDSHATYNYIIEHADELGIDKDNIVLSGYSIGGQMALGLAYRLKEYEITARGISALFPAVDDRCLGPSAVISFNSDNLGVEEKMMTWNSFYGASNIANSALSPEIVPNHATVAELKGMPPVFIHLAEVDPNRDEGLMYASKLLEANVMTSIHLWPGINHASFYSGGPFELKNRFFAEVIQNIKDMMTGDLRRPWNK